MYGGMNGAKLPDGLERSPFPSGRSSNKSSISSIFESFSNNTLYTLLNDLFKLSCSPIYACFISSGLFESYIDILLVIYLLSFPESTDLVPSSNSSSSKVGIWFSLSNEIFRFKVVILLNVFPIFSLASRSSTFFF